MRKTRVMETVVGLFIIAAFLGLFWMAFQVSGVTSVGSDGTYKVTASFDNIGSLKVGSAVKMAGVTIGQISDIKLNRDTLRAMVTMQIDDKDDNLPRDTSADIYTEGLLGSNYISFTPGFDTAVLKNGDQLQTAHSAVILEKILGQLIYSNSSSSKK